ncbi:hypothetical protein RAS1_30420 [Phycisphaerae bacterium RAS1]|nr:hypothetical protein RAS1_30420 [Phycisphaerae bacterium RAS1]
MNVTKQPHRSSRAAWPALALAASAPLLAINAAAAVRFVRAGAAGANDGTSWQDAFVSLQAALAAAQSGDSGHVVAARRHATQHNICYRTLTISQAFPR